MTFIYNWRAAAGPWRLPYRWRRCRREEDSMHLRSIALTLATLALALVAACGGGESKGSPLSGGSGSSHTWGDAKADDLTHAALLSAADLPGSGWSTKDDDFGDDDKAMASGCSDFEGFKKDARAANVSRAKRQFEKAGSS